MCWDCLVEPLNTHWIKATLIINKSLNQMEDTKSQDAVYVCYACAMLLLRFTFLSLEIKNVHSHKLETTLVAFFFYSKYKIHKFNNQHTFVP